MFTTKITTLSRASLAGVVLIIAAFFLTGSKARAQTEKAQIPASSLAEVTLELKAKFLIILRDGEKIKGKGENINIGDGTLSIKMTTNQATIPRDYKIRRLSESEIFRIYQVKGTSRGRGAKRGALIGAASVAGVLGLRYPGLLQGDASERVYFLVLPAIVGAGIGSAIGALVSREKKILIYQNPVVSPPSGLKTGMLNFRDGRLSFAVPITYLRPDNIDRFRVKPSKKNTKHIDLVQIDF